MSWDWYKVSILAQNSLLAVSVKAGSSTVCWSLAARPPATTLPNIHFEGV